MAYLLALDQGTTSSRAIVFDADGRVRGLAQQAFAQHFPAPDRVEHDPQDILRTQLDCAREALANAGVAAREVAAIGIANQRETTVVWEQATGRPIHRAIVWQSRQSEAICAGLRARGAEALVRERTGLLIDPYFSGTKLKWLLDTVPGARAQAERGELRFGTIDRWLLWNLTGGRVHATDASNAARTLLYDIHTRRWDDELLALLDVPPNLLPEVRASSAVLGSTDPRLTLGAALPIAGLAGDQQAALFGQQCFAAGEAKCTYGTGAFLLLNTGERAVPSKNGMLTTLGWERPGEAGKPEVCYALEGSAFVAGAMVQWLRDGLQIIKSASEIEALARSVPDSGGVVAVPALAGLGAPYWRPEARGLLWGLSRGTTRAHIARAALEGIALQNCDLLAAMEADAGLRLGSLRVDGGAAQNDLLMQLQADLLGVALQRPQMLESTALGAVLLAGLGVGVWRSLGEVTQARRVDRVFRPQLGSADVAAMKARWAEAVGRA